jgi:2-dehydro-3-deoxyphosphogalactonate aldolase
MEDASGPNQPTTQLLRNALQACPLIAVQCWIGPEDVESVADVLVDVGFRLIEVPLNSPAPYESIGRLARRFNDRVLIGARTVMSPHDVDQVRAAGGRLIVMPHADVEVVRAARSHGFACFPGVATPTEGFAALAAGADGLKIFPAEAISPGVLKAWRAVFAQQIPLLPTGGITPETMAAWVAAGASCFGVGGNLYAPGRSLQDIRNRANAFVSAWHATEHSRGCAEMEATCTSPV